MINYNENIFYQFLSAISSIVLTVTVIYIKREIERNNRENYYNGLSKKDNILGDIKIKLNEELPRENFIKLITMWAIQPLLLLVLISFTNNHNSYFKIYLFFILIVFTLLNEFLTGLKYSDNLKYQFIMLVVWLLSFTVLSYEKNNRNIKTQENETEATAFNNSYTSSQLLPF